MKTPLTEEQIAEVIELGERGKLGRGSVADSNRCAVLYELDPEGYEKARRIGVARAVGRVNPMAPREDES